MKACLPDAVAPIQHQLAIMHPYDVIHLVELSSIPAPWL
jgi:hypothetical protein